MLDSFLDVKHCPLQELIAVGFESRVVGVGVERRAVLVHQINIEADSCGQSEVFSSFHSSIVHLGTLDPLGDAQLGRFVRLRLSSSEVKSHLWE